MKLDIKVHSNDLPDDLSLGNIIAVDCEMGGLNVKRDPLCLIQISSGKSDAHIVKIDRNTYKAPNIIKILEDHNIKKIFHFARADLAFINFYFKAKAKNVDCTKIKSKLSRTYSDKHGLKDLIKEFVGIDISKQKQSSDFGGELSESQIKDCANDVLHLHKINESLDKILVRENRMKLYKDTIKFIDTRVELDIASFTDDIWSH